MIKLVPLCDKHIEIQLEFGKAAKMLDEGNTRLAAAAISKTFHNVEVAQLLIGNATKKLDSLKAQLSSNTDQINQLRKKAKK